ncbi:hypothetical protein B0H15DRAFT_777743 [Mycena belliarum]|uniref:Uncharacterized protein n=1 Tax=Mycena belliarum TaxID=1033014 RepID=A0AAD6XTI4_9AGAR|nr:hypothetical protein B0H15DRAFT_777743 [Mycena belliae]
MESVPPEIWTDIFAFACTDDGSTGRALSTVSRAVHLASKPLKYQSICVVGPIQLRKLLTALSALSPRARQIKYLFVANLDASIALDVGGPESTTEIQRTPHADPDKAATTEEVVSTEEALLRMLHLSSSSLVALHIHCTEIYRQSLLPEMTLPHLSELTLHSEFRSVQPTTRQPHALLPSLRRMRIHHFGYLPPDFLRQIAHAAPRLTHLRVPQRSVSPYTVQVALGLLQGVAAAPACSLEEVVIELDPAPTSVCSWAGNIRAEQFLRKFRTIARGDKRVCLVDGRNGWMTVDEAKEGWLQDVCRLEGSRR